MRALLVILFLLMAALPASAQTGDPARLFETTGLHYCDPAYRKEVDKVLRTRVIKLEGEDLSRVLPLLREHFGDKVIGALYTYGPESTPERRGQPGFVAVGIADGEWCTWGWTGSYSMEPYLHFDRKYGDIVK